MIAPLDLLRSILDRLAQLREHDAGIGRLQGLDQRTLQDIGMDHYGITSLVFRQNSSETR